MGFVFQAYNLVPTLTALENVMLALDLRGASLAHSPALAHQALAAVGLSHRANASPSKLSGGEKQRVAIARALAGSPSVILADEPTAALDSENGRAVMALLAEVAKDTCRAVMVVTHDHRTLSYGDRLIRIEDGRIVGRARRRAQDRCTGGRDVAVGRRLRPSVNMERPAQARAPPAGKLVQPTTQHPRRDP